MGLNEKWIYVIRGYETQKTYSFSFFKNQEEHCRYFIINILYFQKKCKFANQDKNNKIWTKEL